MTLVRWDSCRDVAALKDQMGRMFEGFYVRPQEDLTRGAWRDVPSSPLATDGNVRRTH